MKAKKSYGQHFLNNERIAERIASSLSRTDLYARVLEIGPGRGMLTKYLLDKDFELFAVEADRDMVEYLNRQYPALSPRIISGDFLKIPLEKHFGEEPIGLIGNFPYNISSQILFKMLEYRRQIPELVGMFQREVAQRVIAGPGSKTYGVISVLVQAYYEGKYLFSVDRRNFNPPPKVQSGVIRLTRKEQLSLGCDETLFRNIVKQTFNQRRKMLRNTMKEFVPDDPVLEEPLFRKRPEELSVEEFIDLTLLVESKSSF